MPTSATELDGLTVLVAGVAGGAGGSAACDVCTHPRQVHDSVATRYCAATLSSALSRGCVCTLPAPA